MRKWTEREREWLIENAGLLTIAEMARQLGRNYASINSQLQDLRRRKRLMQPTSHRAHDVRMRGENHSILMTRIRPWRPGKWVVVRVTEGTEIRRVRTLTFVMTEGRDPVWRVIFEDGRCVDACQVVRLAHEDEIPLRLAA